MRKGKVTVTMSDGAKYSAMVGFYYPPEHTAYHKWEMEKAVRHVLNSHIVDWRVEWEEADNDALYGRGE